MNSEFPFAPIGRVILILAKLVFDRSIFFSSFLFFLFLSFPLSVKTVSTFFFFSFSLRILCRDKRGGREKERRKNRETVKQKEKASGARRENRGFFDNLECLEQFTLPFCSKRVLRDLVHEYRKKISTPREEKGKESGKGG